MAAKGYVDDNSKPQFLEANWAMIELDYSMGFTTISEIAAYSKVPPKYIRARAAEMGWERVEKTKVLEKANTLVQMAVAKERIAEKIPTPVNATALELSALVCKQTILEHRTKIKELRGVVDKFALELLAEHDGHSKLDLLSGKPLPRLKLAVKADILKKLTETFKVLVGLERQAIGLAENGNGDSDTKSAEPTEMSRTEAARRVAFLLAQERTIDVTPDIQTD